MTNYASNRGWIVPPNLDDRSWQDLVDEMRGLIPKYAPQWTDTNPSDLGVSLIELFAWLAEGIIYRLNRVPEKNYLAFLNLLGITRDPPTPAYTYLTFTGGPGDVPAGTQAQTRASETEQPVIFETDEPVRVLPVNMKSAIVIGPDTDGDGLSEYGNLSAILVGPPTGKYEAEIPAGTTIQICLGFDERAAEAIMIRLRFYRPVLDPGPVALDWVYSNGTAEPLAWEKVPDVGDATGALQRDGSVRLALPADWAKQRPSAAASEAGPPAPWTTVAARDPKNTVGEALFWVGMRITNNAGSALKIGLDRVLFNSALAHNALTIRVAEMLGASTGAPFQTFALPNRPLYLRPASASAAGPPHGDLRIEVSKPVPPERVGQHERLEWEEWTLVEELPPGPGNFYRVNPVSGEIGFGNHDAQSERGHGSIPPAGTQIRASTYRYVAGGVSGNIAPGRVTALSTTREGAMPPGITGVTNLGPGLDGSDEEPIEDTLRRAPEDLKIRNRAVTVEDYEFLAREATTDVFSARCLPPRLIEPPPPALPRDPWTFGGIVRAPGTVNVIIVADQGPDVPRPEPTPALIREVQTYLDRRRDLTAHLAVFGPRYLPVIVQLEMTLWQQALNAGADENQIREELLRRIMRFLHPTRGGPAGNGWQVGQPVFVSDLFKAIMPSADLGYISSLQVKADTPLYGTDRPFALSPLGASVRVADYELVCAADATKHVIKQFNRQPA